MLKQCPQCRRLSVEFDYYHHAEKCLNKECGWVNRSGEPLPDVTLIPSVKLSVTLANKHKGGAPPGE